MSLINEALKKAQRRQHEQQATAGGADSPAGSFRPRGKSNVPQTLLVIGAGAAALVVVSVVITVVLLNRAPDSPTPAPSSKLSVAPVLPETASPVIVAPVISRPDESMASAALSESAAAASSDAIKSEAAPNVTDATPAASAAPLAIPPVADLTLSEQVQAFVDAVRVTGIRSSGADSKVLMNDRVYRVNDVIDRALGIKLLKVEAARLVFTDANGTIYEKSF